MRTGAPVLIFVLIIAGAEARADDTHYQDYPLGGRAVGLGGAFTAISDDPSGIFFNPAGIVDSTRTNVQISTTLYGLEISDTLLSSLTQVTNFDRVFTELNVIPSSGSYTDSIGDLGEDGLAKRSYGLGAFVPSYRSRSIQSTSEISPDDRFGSCDQLAYQRTLLDRSFYFGAAYGERIDDTWRVGIATFLNYRALRDLEETSCFQEVPTAAQTAFATAQTQLNMGVANLLVSFGVKASLPDDWYFGLNLMTPTMRIWNTASLRVTRGSADPSTGETDYVVRDLRDIDANSRVGTIVRVGLAKVVPKVLTLATDLTLHAPVHYSLFELNSGEAQIRDAITLVTDVERHFVINLNAGLEYLVARDFSLSGGFFTNFSSAPRIPNEERFDTGRLPYINAFGGSFVLGFFSEHTLTRAGVTASYGGGNDVVPRVDGLGALGRQTEFVKVDIHQTFVFFFISSTFRY